MIDFSEAAIQTFAGVSMIDFIVRANEIISDSSIESRDVCAFVG
jgi:hypothetical protein